MRSHIARVLLSALLLTPLAVLLGGCAPDAASEQVASSAAAPELKWEELIPKSWDPTRRYRNTQLSARITSFLDFLSQRMA